MGKLHTLFVVVTALAAMAAAQAATVIETDFRKGEQGWKLNQDAQILTVKLPDRDPLQVLSLTQNLNGQTGTAWTEIKQKAPSFSFIADVRIRFTTKNEEDPDAPFNQCPADGHSMVFAPVETDALGGGGGSLGLFGLDTFTAFEVNTWRGQGLGTDDERNDDASCSLYNHHETFAFDVVNPEVEDSSRYGGGNGTPELGGAKIGQAPPPQGMKIVNGGFYRYQWNVAEDGTMSVYITGLEDVNREFQKVKVLEVKFPNKKHIDFEGRWGFTAATGGAVQSTDVLYARIDVPMIAPQ